MKQSILKVLVLAGVLQGFPVFAEEEAPALKVTPVADRPIVGPTNPAVSKVPAEPAKSPAPPPAATPSPGATPAEKESAESAASSDSNSIVPESFPLSRYASLWENSPFQNESIAPPQQSEGLAQRFVLGGILRENGEPVVWVRERATQQSYKVSRNFTNNLGLSLVEVNENMQKQSDASATVKLGNEQGIIKFDSVAAGGMPGGGIAPPPMARPAVPVPLRNPQMGMPMPNQAFPNNPQATAGVPGGVQHGVVPSVPGPGIPANGQVQAPGQAQMPPPRVIRRRAIVPSAPSTP